MLDADRLDPIEEVGRACQEIEKGLAHAIVRGGENCCLTLPTDLADGHHRIGVPEPLRSVDEIVLLVSSPSADRPDLRLAILKPSEESVEVIAQDWFNRGNWDFGYQWPTRVARDPLTGRVFGDGIRMGRFVLDPSNRNVEEWLSRWP